MSKDIDFKLYTIEEITEFLSWNISKNHTGRWGCIKGTFSRTYSFMHEDKEEVVKWILKNYKNN